ncbi:MAG: 30S ribosomal protein S14 [Legionellales bacterium]|nr:30S ribosomal protein S14 [Legionellales bacterium]|tara:strand:+ start:1022 stop:1324 length:303 start_codon:yes stop_codon:yes gene_type:complete
MATKRMMARERQLERKFKSQDNRNQLKKILSDPNSTGEDIMNAMMKLQARPVDESPSRRYRRCVSCGRSHGVYRRFGLCRLCIRKYASLGWIPGLVKASW